MTKVDDHLVMVALHTNLFNLRSFSAIKVYLLAFISDFKYHFIGEFLTLGCALSVTFNEVVFNA
jgi:hypothetical protein